MTWQDYIASLANDQGANPAARRLAQHYESTLPENVGVPKAVINALLGGTLGLPGEVGLNIARAGGGILDALNDPRAGAAFLNTDDNPYARLLAAHEAQARVNPVVAGAEELAFDPLNFIGMGGGARAAAPGASAVGRLLREIDAAASFPTALPFEALKAARARGARRLGAEIAARVPAPPAVDLPPLPPQATLPLADLERGIAGKVPEPIEAAFRDVTPPSPPAIAAPPRAPLTADLSRDIFLDQIMAAPVAQRAQVLGALHTANFGGGATNAMRSVTGGTDLGALGDLERPYANYLLQRTIENPDAITALQNIHPALHRAVDLMPDLPGATALDLQNEVRRAAGLAEKAPKGTKAARAVEPAAEVIAPQGAAQGATGASAPAIGKVEFGGAQYTPIADNPLSTTPMPLKLEMQYGGLPEAEVARLKAQEAGQLSLGALPPEQSVGYAQDRAAFFDNPQTARDRIAEIEASPEGRVFKYINPSGQFKSIDTRTGRAISVRGAGGRIRENLEAPWNTPGTHYDEVAQEALSSRLGPDAVDRTNLDDFFTGARELWRERNRLRAQLRGGGAEAAGGGGMMMVSPLSAGIQAGKAVAPTIEQLGKNIGAQEFLPGVREGLARMNRSWGGAPVRGGFWSYVRSSSIQNPRNLLQDPATTRAISRVFNADLATPLAHHGDVANLLDAAQEQLVRNAGAATPFGKQADVLQDTARAVLGEDRVLNLGGGGIAGQAENALRDMPYLQRLTYQLGTDVLGATRGNPTSLLTLPAAPVKAALRPVIDEAFRRMNRLSQVAGREGMAANVLAGEAERAAPAFLDGLAAQGVDVAPLAAKSGQFSPQEVAALAGAQAGREWRTIAEQAAAVAERETKHYFGDFAKANFLESVPVLNKMVWLSSWSTRMLPVFAEIAARHPGPTLAYAGLVRAQGEQLTKEGKPPYQAGTLPVPGTNLRVDPVQGLSPVGGEVLSMGQGDEGARSPYQTGEDILGKFGIPLHPAVRAGAYATGLTPQRPSDLNRTAGLERLPQLALQGAGVDLPYLPPFGQIALDTARRGINVVKQGAGLPTSSIPPTPIEKRMAELWFDQTGSPLASSPEGLFMSLDKNSDLYKLAERDVLRGQGVTNAASYTLPLGVQTDNPTASAAHAARAAQPHPYEEIDAVRARGDLAGARRMQAENARFMAENPQAAIYQGVSLDARKAALKDEWDRLHANWPRNAYYDAQRAAFRAWIDAGAPGDPPGVQQPKTIPPPKKAPLPALSGR